MQTVTYTWDSAAPPLLWQKTAEYARSNLYATLPYCNCMLLYHSLCQAAVVPHCVLNAKTTEYALCDLNYPTWMYCCGYIITGLCTLVQYSSTAVTAQS